uniref:Plexin b2b n=1 Tax=Astyanax mexicanus TaxID=7994 RepID=A0A8B9L9M9_ASTMX
MAGWVQMVLFLLWCVFLSESSAEVLEFPTDTRINNVVQDPATGRVYLGAVNTIYQLDAFLKLEARAETGPKKDARTCTPPVSACTTADLKDTNNINKLLLVHHTNGSLIVCGSVYKGICSLLNLSNVNQEIYYSDTKGERTYAASTDENISVVGVMATFLLKENPDKKTFPVFLIAKAHGGPEDNPKLIATRILENYKEWVVFESIVEASPVQVFPHGLKYQHQFRFAFKDSDYIYFLFSRTRDESDNKNFTFLSRLCERDESYYSYTELQLNCSRNGVQYNKVQAAYVTEPGKELARAMLDSGQYGTVSVWDKVLFIVASPDGEDATDSALCMYPLKRINERVEDILNACYTDYGKIGGRAAVYSPYKSITDNPCQNHHTVSQQFLGPSEFLRYPLASRPQFALQAEAVFSRQGRGHLTAVAVAVENDHTIAFLGSSVGEVVKTVYFLFNEILKAPFVRSQAKNCPRFENPDPVLIPVGFKTRISFEGVNLGAYKVIFVFLSSVTLYNCSLGREDCSLCKNADPKYQCVWCARTRSCVFEKLCTTDEAQECPDPGISAIIPRYGPILGGISVTIKGSNLGIQKEDIKSITVAGVPCTQQEEKYSVSTSVVCEIGAVENLKPFKGLVEVEVKGGKKGTSSVYFNYRDPKPEAVHPNRGPRAGGTVITITGTNLDTGSKEDVVITVDGVPCPLCVDCQCLDSVICFSGGRQITVIGSGFALIQRASIRVQVADEWSGLKTRTTAEVCIHSLLLCTCSSVQGRGFSKAMTAKEALAFVGDVSCNVNTLQDDKLFLDPPSTTPSSRSKRQRRDIATEPLDLLIKFGHGEWVVGSVHYERKYEVKLDKIIIPAVVVPMLLIIAISIVCYRRKSQQAEREYEKVKHQLENLEESVRDRCKKEFTDLMIEMEDHTNDLSEGRIPFLDYKTYTDRVFFLPSKDGANDVMITGKLDIPESRKAIVAQALNQFSNLLNSKTFLITFIRTLEARPDFNARAKVYCASLLTVALHGKLEYYTDIMRTLLLGLMEEYVQSKNPKLMLQQVYKRMCLHCFFICLQDSAGEPLYKLFRAIKHQIEKGPVDAQVKKAKYTLNDTGLLGDDVEYSMLTLQVLVQGEGPDITPVKVLDCDTISQVKEKIIEQVYKNLPYSQRPKVESVTLEWRPGSTGQILSDLDVTSQKEGRWRRLNTLAHYNVRDNATLVLSRLMHTQQSYYQNHDNHEERNALLEDDKVFHLVRPADELDEMKSKRGSIKDKSMTKAITEIYLTRLLSVKGTLQQFVDDFFRSVLCSGTEVPPAVKYFFDFLDEQALKHDNVDEETIHIWKTNSLPLRFWVNILKNPHFIFDVHVTEVVDASLSVIAQTFMDACTKSEHKLSRDSPSNKLLYAKEISSYKKMVDEYYKGIRVMVPVSDQDMNTHLAEVSRAHTDKLNTQVALHQLYQYASKYYKEIVLSLDEDPAAQSKQLTFRLQQIAAALENKVTDL